MSQKDEFLPWQAKRFLSDLERWMETRYLRTGKINFGDDSLVVTINHDDGSSMTFHNAHILKHKGYWFVLTEHQSHHYFHEEEVQVMMFKRLYIEASNNLKEYLDTGTYKENYEFKRV